MGYHASTDTAAGYRVHVARRADRDALNEWDRFVDGVALSDVTQLSAWSTVKAYAGLEPLHVFVRRSGELVGGAQVFVRRIPVMGSVAYLSAGPVVADGLDDRAEVVATLGAAMRHLLRSELRVLFVQPPAGADDVSAELARNGFRPSRAGIAPAASLRIDLRADEEELRGRLHETLRYWTRRWPDRGVVVRVGGEGDVPLLAELMARSAAFKAYEPPSLDYLRLLYGSLAPSGNAALFVGEVHGAPVAANLYTRCGGVLCERLIGFARDSQASKLRVPAAVKWHAMLWAKRQGMRWFDFGGIRLEIAEALLAGRTFDQDTAGGNDYFKISFGCDPYLMPVAVEDARPRLALRAYDLAQRSERGRSLVKALQLMFRGGKRDRRSRIGAKSGKRIT